MSAIDEKFVFKKVLHVLRQAKTAFSLVKIIFLAG